jgi:hypothetical protein
VEQVVDLLAEDRCREIAALGAIGCVSPMLAVQRLGAVERLVFLLRRLSNQDPPAFERVTLEQILVEHDRQRVLVGLRAGMLACGILHRKALRRHHFGCDVARGAEDVGRKEARHNQRINVDDDCASARGVEQHVALT